MGVRNRKREELRRLASKSLDAQFTSIVRKGLGCAPFAAEAVLGAVKEVYAPFLDEAAAQAPPGKVTLVAVRAEERAGLGFKKKNVAKCLTALVDLLSSQARQTPIRGLRHPICRMVWAPVAGNLCSPVCYRLLAVEGTH